MTKPPLRVGELIRRLDQFDHDAIVLTEQRDINSAFGAVQAVTKRRVCRVVLAASSRPFWVGRLPPHPDDAEMIEEVTEDIVAVVLRCPT